MNKKGQEGLFWIIVTVFIITLILVGTFFFPLINVWWAEQSGKADFAKAEQNRKIAVLEADAKRESSILLAQAEVERARGVAEANKIIGDSLKNNENYIKYLWIDAINNKEHQIIYVPTEGQIPIMEANRLE